MDDAEQRDFREEIIDATMCNGLFTRAESVALLRSIRGDAPDQLRENIEMVVEWCLKAKQKAILLESIMNLSEFGLIEITWSDGEPALRLRPDLDIKMDETP